MSHSTGDLLSRSRFHFLFHWIIMFCSLRRKRKKKATNFSWFMESCNKLTKHIKDDQILRARKDTLHWFNLFKRLRNTVNIIIKINVSLESWTWNYNTSVMSGQASTNHKPLMLMGVFMKHEYINVSSYLMLYSSLLYSICMNFSWIILFWTLFHKRGQITAWPVSQSLTCSHSVDLLAYFRAHTVSGRDWHLELGFDQSKQIKLVLALRMAKSTRLFL